MPSIDFYLLRESTSQARLVFACRLLDKACEQHQPVYVHAAHEAMAHQVNDLLWIFRDVSFIPHQLAGEAREPRPPVEIGWLEQHLTLNPPSILLNLDQNIPGFFNRFQRILEIVTDEEEQLTISRNKYREYQKQRCEIKINDLKGKKS